ncbi:hypothetical protein [Lacisediminihabitans sp. H27-G8]|uniref:hypothetical protein n=1 Tax=Lacisediminihabitans sp. H27-G8 TaxID=3111909 RepID=UPI0038FCA75C
MSTKSRKSIVLAIVTVVLVGGGGAAAFAYWTATGTGTGTGATGTNAAVTVVQTSTITNLRPGGAAQTLSGNFTNPNDSPTYVTSVTASIASVTKAGGAPAGTCDATDYTLAAATMTVGAQVPSGTAQGSWTGATIAFNNKPAANQDACKGATVNFAYTSN